MISVVQHQELGLELEYSILDLKDRMDRLGRSN